MILYSILSERGGKAVCLPSGMSISLACVVVGVGLATWPLRGCSRALSVFGSVLAINVFCLRHCTLPVMPNPTRRLFGDIPRGDTSERTAASEEQQANKRSTARNAGLKSRKR